MAYINQRKAMFTGLTFFGIPIECFLRFGEAIIVAIIALIIMGVIARIAKKEKDKYGN